MSERRAAGKGRRLGSSRRRQVREGPGETPVTAPAPGEEPPQASEIVQRVQDFLGEQHKDQEGFVTRSDMQKLQEEGFPCSTEELELVFDGLDAAGTGRLGTEEFTAGLRQFLGSQKAAREHRRRKTASRRVRLVLPGPALEGVDSEEQRHFAAFMDQLGTNNASEEQEIWQLWVKLRQDEPQLLGNLEDFLAKMRHRIQEAKSKKEALEVTLNKRVAEHDKEVQQLCEVLEQQIQQEQQRLEQKSMARSHQHVVELQRVLDASEREVQRLVTAQMELERRCRSLRRTQQVTSTENRELEESNRVLEHHLQHLHQQLEQTQGHLRTMRATVAWEHVEEPGDTAVTELPSEMPTSPQMSPGTSEKFRSEMRIRLGSQSGEGKARSTHQVVWDMLPAEISISGAPVRTSSVEEDPFPEFLKEERLSDQSSLLREMNDAIAALSKHLKAQEPDAPLALADTASHPRDDAEPQTGPEAATAHGITPGILQETLPGHVSHKLFEGDLKEGPATAELGAPDVTQAGASVGAGHHMAQEPGAEQGESPEEAQRMLFLQGKVAGVKEMVLKVSEHLGESKEAGEQAAMEVEGAGWMQEKPGWEKAPLLGEAEEEEISWGESLEAGLEPPEAGQAGLAVGQCLAMEELEPGSTAGKCVQASGMALQEWADPSLGLSEKLEKELGEHLEPEPPSWGEVQMGAAQGAGVLPEVTVAPGPGVREEQRVRAEAQPQGEPWDAEVLPARAEHGMSSRARGEEEEGEEAQLREADLQLQGESVREDTGQGGSAGAEVLLAVAVPPPDVQKGGVGADVELLEAQNRDANMQLLAEMEADLQCSSEAGSPGTEQGGRLDPDVQPLEEEDEPQLGLEEEMEAAEVHGEGPSPAETLAGSPDLGGLFPVKSQALELVEAEDAHTDVQLRGGLSPETLWGVKDGRAVQAEEEEDGAQGQDESGLPREPVLEAHGGAEGAGAGVQPQEEAERLDTPENQSTDANMKLLTEVEELTLIPGGSTEADLQPPSEPGSLETEQRGSVDPDVQPQNQVDKGELVEMVETEDSWIDIQLCGRASPETPQQEVERAAMELRDEAEDGGQGQGKSGLPQEPVPHPSGVTFGQGEGAGAGVQTWEETVISDMVKDQSTGATVQLLAEGDELRPSPAVGTEAHLQPPSETDTLRSELGGRVAPDVQPLDQVDKRELVEIMETENSWIDVQVCEGASPETPKGEGTGAAMELRDEDEEQGHGESGQPEQPVPHPSGVTTGQGEGAGAGVQAWKESENLDTVKDQSTGANAQLIAELDELKLTPGGSPEADLQLLGEAGSPGTEQGGRMDPDVQPLSQVDEEELVEMEAENAQPDVQLHGGLKPGAPWGGEGGTAIHMEEEEEEEEDGAQGQGECELPQEPVLDPHGAAAGQGEEAGAGVQAWKEAERLDTLQDQSTDVNVKLLTEMDELKSTPERGTEADLQLLGEAESPGTEQGGRLDPNVQPLDQMDEQELVEVQAEDAQTDTQLGGGLSSEASREGEGEKAVQLEEEEEDGGQDQGECELLQEPVLDVQGAAEGQGEWAGEDRQPQEKTESLDTLEDQSTDVTVQSLAEVDELKLTPGESSEADLQLLSEAGSPGTGQGGRFHPEVQPLNKVDEQELVEMEAENAQEDTILSGGLNPGGPWEREGGTAIHMEEEEEEEDGAQGQGECELPQEPVLDPHGAATGQREGAGAGVQAWKEAERLDTVEDQSTGANMQLFTEVDELKSIPGGSPEADLQLLGEAGPPGTEQGGRLDPDVQPLDRVDKAELGEREREDSQLCCDASPETPQGEVDYTAMELGKEAEDGGQGQVEHGLQELVPHSYGVTTGQGAGAGTGVQRWEEAGNLDPGEEQSTVVNVQLIAELDELKLTPGESPEADLQLLGEAGSPGTEQGGRMDPDVQPLSQVDEEELVEMEAENAQPDVQLHGGLKPGAPWGGEGGTAIHMEEEEEEDGAQGQGECELPQEPVLDPHGAAAGQGEGAGAGVQAWKEAERLDTVEDQSTDANMQLFTELDELKSASGESTESDLQMLSKTDSLGTEQGESVDPAVQPRDQVNTAELEEMLETEDSWMDKQLSGDASPESPQQEGDHEAMKLREKAEGWGQGQGERGLPQEPGMDTLEDQSTDANVKLLAEEDALKLVPGGSTEADLQLLGEAGSPGTEQGGRLYRDVQPLDQMDEQELVEMQAEDAQTDTQLSGGLNPGAPWGGEGEKAVQLEEEEDEGQDQGECELPQEPVLAEGQGEWAGEDMQPQEEAESLDTLEDRSTDVTVQSLAEVDELTLIPGGNTEADLQPSGKTDCLGTEQGVSVDPGMQPLDEVDKGELVEMETEDCRTDTQLCGGASTETLQEKGGHAAMQLRDEVEDGEQGQGEPGLLHDPGLDPQGARARQGEGAGAGVQPAEEAEHWATLEGQSTGANMQLFAEEDEPKSASGGSAEADLAPLGAAGMWEGEQSLAPGLGAGLCAAHTADTGEGPAAAHVPPSDEADSYPEPVTAAEGLGLEVKLGTPTGPDGQIPEDTQAPELPQGERAAAGGAPLDGAQGLEVAQGERLEAGLRSVVKTPGLGLHQGHGDGVSAPASPASDVPLQTGTVKLEMMMQEDVLIPDVWRLCASGQAAQSELQEQVSAQGHQVRIHTPAQQPEGKTPRVTEPEQAAARSAQPPRQEVPPVSTLHMKVQPQEDAGNNQLGVVLAESSLGDAANPCVHPQRQLLGEQSEESSAGQREKPQEFGLKMSQAGEPSPGEPKAVTAAGAEASPKGCPKAPLGPDHLYNVLFVGDSHVGKTSFLYRLHADSFNPNLTATVGLDYRVKNLVVDNKSFALRLWDSAGQERYHSMTKQFFRKADGVVLMYDVTSQYSFSDVRYWLSCIQEAAEDGVAILLLGNKTDCAAERQVPTKEGERLAKEHQLMFCECSAASGHNVLESMVSFIRLLKVREDELKNKAEEVPKAPQKKKSCCW